LAKKALEDFIAGRPVTCKQVDYDARNNRPVAQCFAGEDDLQAMMVSAGWAWSFGRYSERYAPEEKEAATRKAGVHAHRCLPPWEWRAQVGASGSLMPRRMRMRYRALWDRCYESIPIKHTSLKSAACASGRCRPRVGRENDCSRACRFSGVVRRPSSHSFQGFSAYVDTPKRL
jgi:hypothetical protein